MDNTKGSSTFSQAMEEAVKATKEQLERERRKKQMKS